MTQAKRPRIWPYYLLIYGCLLAGVPGYAVDLTYVAPETKSLFEKDFDSAKQAFSTALDSTWSCEMVGVRSRLQHQENIPLYSFKNLAQSLATNDGASPIKSFKINATKTELDGVQGKIRDQVRKLNDKQIISRMSLVDSDQTLAYARCTKT